MTRRVGIIVAMSPEGVIGLHGKIPWRHPGDQRRFKRLTVGTTVVRSLETAAGAADHGGAADDGIAAYRGPTRIFIKPGHRFRAVDAMVTNFHLPESTLLMLCSAFVGREALLAAYAHAVRARYRFFSYGDAMFLTPSTSALERA